MLKVDRATHTHPFLPAEPVCVRRGASAALYQSTSSSAAKGEFFSLWSVVKTISRFISIIFSSIWHLICCCPSHRLSWLTVELVKPLLDEQKLEIETLTKISDGVFKIQGKDGKTRELTFWIKEKNELAWAFTLDGETTEANDWGPSFVFAHDPEEVPDKVAYYHQGHVGYLRVKEAGNGQYAVDGIASQGVRKDFEKEFAKKGDFIWESHYHKKQDADLSWITDSVALGMLGLSSTARIEKTGPGAFIQHDKGRKVVVNYYINTLDEFVEYFPDTNKRNIIGTQLIRKRHAGGANYMYLIYDSGKQFFLFQKKWDENNAAHQFSGIVVQGILDQLAKDVLDNSIWQTRDKASTEVLKRNGFKYHEASRAWVRSEEKE